MKLIDAEILCKQLMKKHKLGKVWKFDWMNKKRVYGDCCYSLKTIRLSKRFVEINPEKEVKNTILHEIAHAKCRKRGHNKYFYKWCEKLGTVPERCNNTANQPK